jgi:putative transposase
MPWKVCKPMDERPKFIARLLDGETMAVACRDFGICRKTGYKMLTRYNEIGLDGLTDRSRRPYRHATSCSSRSRRRSFSPSRQAAR